MAGPRTAPTLDDSLDRASSPSLLLFSYFGSGNVLAGDQYPGVRGREAGAGGGRLHGGADGTSSCSPRPGPVCAAGALLIGKEVETGKKEKVRIMKETGVCAMDALDAHRHLTMHVHAPAPAHMHTHVHTHAHTCTCSCRWAGEVRSEKGERETGGWTPQGWDTYSFSITIPALTTTSGP